MNTKQSDRYQSRPDPQPMEMAQLPDKDYQYANDLTRADLANSEWWIRIACVAIFTYWVLAVLAAFLN